MRSRSLVGAVLTLSVGPLPAHPQSLMSSAAISDVRYEVTFDTTTAETRQIRVRMTFRTGGAEPVVLSLPAWTPGAYELSYFARNVLSFTATAGDRPLRWDKLDYDTWRIQPDGAQSITVSFAYLADSLDNAMAWSRPDFALFNGTNVFLYAEGRPFEQPARVAIHTTPGWRIATGMARGVQPGEFTAPNFHDLVDMPVFVGRLEVDSAEIAGKWYRLATYPVGALSGPSRTEFWSHLRGFMPPLIAVTAEAPWDTYTVMMIFDPEYPGASALEHQNSHVGVYNPGMVQAGPLLASITAHEIFHAWNVKRLRPADLWPYAYDRAQPTTLLWVSEGITDYYADLGLVRGGVITPAQFYQTTREKIDNVAATPATALEDASLSTWIHPTDGSGYLYYPKGSLAGFLLDIQIRDASDNRSSLDGVLRDLYTRFYKAGKGFTVDDWWQAVSRAAEGKSFEEFYRRYIDGREPFPYATVLPLAGLRFQADTTRVPRLGTTTSVDSVGVRVTAVTPSSSAADAGVRSGDYLVKVGDVSVGETDFGPVFRTRYASQPEGSPLPLVVRRQGQTLTLPARLRLVANVSYAITEDQNASAKAVRIRQGILGGTVTR
ncbi:MAG: M61 family metallopeptidase [Gemmatimonadetes bacterium]|nr:M61 family metallopeptidase [Gemmatimonadota bacterium]